MNRDFKGVWIPKEIWLNEELTLLEKIIFVEIDSLDNEDHCTAGNEYFATFCNCSESKVTKAIKKLKELNMIEEISFDGRHRKLRVVKNTTQGSKKYDAESQKVRSNNIDNNQINKKNNSKELLQTSNFSFGKQKPKKENMYTKCSALIYSKTDDKEIQRLLFMWLNVLLEKYKDRGRTLYVNVFSGKLNMLDKYDKKDWKEIIEYNLQRGYEGFYPINNYSKSKDKRADENMVHVPSMTEEDYKREERELAELKKKGVRTTF